MKQSKEHYLSPEAELLVVRFEKAILNGTNLNTLHNRNRTEYLFGSEDDYDEL